MINKLIFSTITFALTFTFMPNANNVNPQANARVQKSEKKALQQVVQERMSSADAMNALGTPGRLRQEENQVGKAVEVLTELTYKDSTLIFIKSSLTESERLVYFKTRHPSYAAKGVQVGDSLSKAKQAFPRLEPVEAYTYQQCDKWGRGDCLRLQVHGGQVSQVEHMFVMD